MQRRKNHLVLKDNWLRKQCASRKERAKIFLKAITLNEFLPRRYRQRAQNYSHNIFSKTKNNLCKETARSRSILRTFQISRHVFRKQAENGFLPGVRRSSW